MEAVERQVVTMTAAGNSAAKIAEVLGVGQRTVERLRARPDVRDLIAAKEATGLSPRDVLETLLYSTSEETRRKAAVDLSRLDGLAPDPDPVSAEPRRGFLLVNPAVLEQA